MANITMDDHVITVGHQNIALHGPSALVARLATLYGSVPCSLADAAHSLSIEPMEGADTFELFDSLGTLLSDLDEADLLLHALQALARIATQSQDQRLAFKADLLLREESPVLIADTGAPGRALATAWLTGRSFTHIGSDWALLDADQGTLRAQQSAMVLSPSEHEASHHLPGRSGQEIITCTQVLVALTGQTDQSETAPPALILLPTFKAGAQFSASVLAGEEAAVQLSQGLLNANQLPSGGRDQCAALGQTICALSITFGAADQLDKAIALIDAVLTSKLPAAALKPLADALSHSAGNKATSAKRAAPPEPTPPRGKKKLTIGMATYDDYDGVYFTLQSLRLHHSEVMDEVELLVVDNNPTGPCAKALKQFERDTDSYRYVPFGSSTGTSASREKIFQEASSDLVLVIDCHVLLAPGAVAKLIDHFDANPGTRDLLQGPMIRGELDALFTHWEEHWHKGMFGRWALDERGTDPAGPPFDIPMQGAALFACRREAWPGFHPRFRGFGGEEGYIHEKVRQRGGRTLCLPFLRWMHRFERPMGIPYPLMWEDRIRNYLIGWSELGLDTTPILEHFADLLGQDVADKVAQSVAQELRQEPAP